MGYQKGPNYQAVRLAYRGGALAMLVLRPDRNDGIRNLEAALSVSMLRGLVRLDSTEVKLALPRFTINWGVDLVEPLRALGIERAFTRQADFSGANVREPADEQALFVSNALHKALSEVNEEGTVAAAATAGRYAILGGAASGIPSGPSVPVRDR